MVAADTRVAPAPKSAKTVARAKRWATAAVALAVAAAFLLPLRYLLRAPAPPMEEGILLVFPDRVLNGDVPHRDFLHLYGPGSLWVLAALFKAFGTRIEVERLVALAGMAVVWGLRAPLVRRAVVGAAIGLSPYLLHVAVAGPGNVWNGMIVDPLFRLRPTRGLPVPPDPTQLKGTAVTALVDERAWPLPKLPLSGQLFAWFVGTIAVVVFLLAVGVWSARRNPRAPRARPR